MPKDSIAKISRDLAVIKEATGKKGEVKWSNAKSYGGRPHRAFADYLFDLIKRNNAHFHIRFSPMKEYDHGGRRGRIDTVSKSFYQLILHRPVRYYHKSCDVWVFPDDGAYTSELPDMIEPLCYQGGEHFPDGGGVCVQDISPRSSAAEPMLQLLDVTLGGLAAIRNGRTSRDGYSPVKRELAEHIFKKTGWFSIEGNSWSNKCNRWNVIPKKRGQ